ncbi:MAG: MFS transporter [Dongiaceae bacterium]
MSILNVASSPQPWRSLAAAIACAAVAGVASGMTWPVLALILDRQGYDATHIGLSSISQSISVFVVLPLAPRLLARWGFVRTTAAGIVGAVAMLLALPLFPDIYAWIPIRFILGASTVTFYTACEIWVNRLAVEESRGRTIGIFGFLWSGGFAAGPLIIALTGSEGWTPFIVTALLMSAAALPLVLASEPPAAADGSQAAGLFGFVRYVGLAPALMAAALLLGALDYANDAFLPLYGLHHGLSQAEALAMLTVLLGGYTVAHIPCGWLADRVDRRRLLLAMAAIAAAAYLAVPAAIDALWLAWLLLFIVGCALSGLWTAAVVLIGQRFAGAELSGAYVAGGILYGLGSLAGPLLAGLFSDLAGLAIAPLVLAGFCLVYLPIGLLRDRRA